MYSVVNLTFGSSPARLSSLNKPVFEVSSVEHPRSLETGPLNAVMSALALKGSKR